MRVRDRTGERIGGIGGVEARGRKQTLHHRLHLRLVGVADADDGFLDVVGRVFGDLEARLRGGQQAVEFLQKLREDGVITRQVALCDAERLKLGVTVFVTIRTSRHSDDWTRQFIEGTRDIPEIVEIYRMTGDVDYLLKMVVPDIKAYDAVYKRLIRVADLSDVSSGFAMEVIKHTTALPLDHLTQTGDS